MADKTLLIPGTGGTRLHKQDDTSIGHPVWLNAKVWLLNKAGLSLDALVRLLSMSHLPDQARPEKTSLEPGVSIKSGPALEVAYNQVLPWIDSVFPYDWRADLEYNADLLLEYLRREMPANGRWRIVTHSQGGIIAIVASKLWAARNGGRANAFSELVSHLCMVAAPVQGTLDAAHALIVGDRLGEGATAEFCRIAGTWPVLYQMLPNWYSIKTPKGDFSQYGFFHAETWAPYPWIDLELLRRAWRIRRTYLDEPIEMLSGIAYSFVLASNRNTWNRAIRTAKGLIQFPPEDRAGDTLVPYKVTYHHLSSTAKHRCHVLGPEENVSEHSMLLNDDVVNTLVRLELSR